MDRIRNAMSSVSHLLRTHVQKRGCQSKEAGRARLRAPAVMAVMAGSGPGTHSSGKKGLEEDEEDHPPGFLQYAAVVVLL